MTQSPFSLPTDITAATTLVGLIGWPISHSVSPVMHNAAFAELRMNWRYVPLPVRAELVGEAVAGARALGLRGVNVTVPHKQAAAIGAVNTIIVGQEGELLGDNTDAAGFVTDLQANGVDPAGQRVLVLGAGGSARAVVYGLAEAGCASLVLLNRTLDKAENLLAAMRELFPDVPMTARPFPDGVAESAAEAELIVNCTSLGMSPNLEGLPWDEEIEFTPEQTVYDLVYNPAVTRLLQLASVDGATVIGGLGMLIRQGAIAFERWTGETAPVEVMQRAVNVVFDR